MLLIRIFVPLAVSLISIFGSKVRWSITSRILDGNMASPKQFPFHVTLLYKLNQQDTKLCGGSIITENYILSAAHCNKRSSLLIQIFYSYNFSFNRALYARAYIGSTSFMEGDPICILPQNHTNHPNYNPSTLEHDISLIKVPRIQFSGNFTVFFLMNTI